MRRLESALMSCALVGVLAAGCAASDTFVQHDSVMPALLEQGPIIDLHKLPDTLPPAVASAAAAVVKITVAEAQVTQTGEATIVTPGFGSGERITPYIYLSAGHVLRSQKNGAEAPKLHVCGQLQVKVPTVESDPSQGTSGAKALASGITLDAQRSVSSFDVSSATVPDVALIQAKNKPGSTFSDHVLSLASGPPKPGDVVFGIGYEPTASNEQRSPDESDLTVDQVEAGNNKPAIYGGIVLGRQTNGDIIVAEDPSSRGYGAIPDGHARQGESGGAEVNVAGQLIGVTIAVTPEPTSAADFQSVWGVEPHVPKGPPYYYEIVQPVGQSIFDQYTKRLFASSHCN